MNIINLVNKYLPVLDEQYSQLSKTAILDMPKEWVKSTMNAKKVKIAKYKSDKLGNYSRHSGFVAGYADLDWEEHEFKIDRGRSIQIDHEDNAETFGLAFGKLAGTFQKDAVIPEMDAYRMAVYSGGAGHKGSFVLGFNSILDQIDHLDALMDDEEVPEEGRLIFVIPSVYESLINDASVQKKLDVNDAMSKALNKKIYNYNEHPIIKITSKRMYTAIRLLDGTSEGQEDGGYEQAPNGLPVGLLMINRDAVVQISKRVVARIWAPSKELAAGTDGVNPNADAWKFDYRVYHDAWVLENKANAIACLVLEKSSLVTGSYDSGTGVWTSGAPFVVKAGGAVKGVLPYKQADATLSLPKGNIFSVKITNPLVTDPAALPAGNIVTTFNSDTGNTQSYTKAAFEADGSLLSISHVNGAATEITMTVEWVKGFVSTYHFSFEDATFAAEA